MRVVTAWLLLGLMLGPLLVMAGCAAPLPQSGGGRGEWTSHDAAVADDAGEDDGGADEDGGTPLCVRMPENPVCNVE